MTLTVMDGNTLVRFLRAGEAQLAANKEQVNALNVFPVPDGDTGTNMYLTISSAVKSLSMNAAVGKVAAELSMGALMGARGNSGVILSQLFRGFALAVEKEETLTVTSFADAWQNGVALAYRSVMKPVEGTILSVSKAFAQALREAAAEDEDILAALDHALQQAKIALDNTPNQLPILKQAGVVDSGGTGFLCIIEGGVRELHGEGASPRVETAAAEKEEPKRFSFGEEEVGDLEYRYCTEMLIAGKDIDIDALKSYLYGMGDCVLAVGHAELVKVHIHTNHPGEVLEHALQIGMLHDIKIDNMGDGHEDPDMELPEEKAVPAPSPAAAPAVPPVAESSDVTAVVAVANGDGMDEIFRSLGVKKVISGGQTMNPSAQDFLEAIKSLPEKEIVLLPNNGNIVMAAKQAAELSEKTVLVAPSKSVTQGIAALLGFNAGDPAESNLEAMCDTMKNVKSGEITYAVRDSSYEGIAIGADDFLGLVEGEVAASGRDMKEVLLEVVRRMVTDGDSLISMFYGNDLPAEDAENLSSAVEEAFPDMDVELHYGGQPLYYFYVSIE